MGHATAGGRVQPLITAIVVTVGRSTLREAVESALGQREADIEVLVVVDGDQTESSKVRNDLEGLPIRITSTGGRSNANVARNLGVREARGRYVAFLDDDDVWRPHKTAAQLSFASEQGWDADRTLLTASVRTIGIRPERVWPARPPSPTESISEYLFARKSLLPRPNLIQTSSWLGSRELFSRLKFDERLVIHQDWDWLLRASDAGGFTILHIDEALVFYRVGSTNSVSSDSSRRDASLAWASNPPVPMDRRVHGDLILMCGMPMAMREGSFEPIRSVWALAARLGRPSRMARLVAAMKIARWRLSASRMGS